MHVTEVVKCKQTTDETVEVTIRCCSNPLTDSTVTMYALDAEKMQADIDKHHDRVAGKCARMSAGKQVVGKLLITSKTHGVL